MAITRTKRLFLFVLLIALTTMIFPQAPVFAESQSMTMDNLYYSIWPEYDRSPDVLVIYSGVFVNDTGKAFEGELQYNIPKGADINMVCETEQGMLCQKYEVKTDNPDYDVIVWKPSHAIEAGAKFPIMMEYYYTPFGAANPKQFTQVFRPAFPINNLTVEIKAPKESSGFSLSPEAEKTAGDDDGFTNYLYSFQNVTSDDVKEFEVSYTRESNEPSVKAEEVQQSTDNSQDQNQSSVNSTIIILLIVFIILLAVFLFIAVNNNNNKKSQQKGKKNNKKGNKTKAKGGVNKKEAAEEKRKLRKMLIDGKIGEDTYKQLLDEIDE